MNQTLTQKQLVFLPLPSCVLVDVGQGAGDCSPDGKICFKCATIIGTFISGESLNDFTSISHAICNIIWTLSTIIGIFGAFANLLIIFVLNNARSSRSFNVFLKSLALCDFFCCVTTVIGVSAQNSFFQNWSRDRTTLELDKWGIQAALLFRSASSWMTVLIAMERYLVVAFPIKFGGWFTVQRNRILSTCMIALSCALAIPRFSSSLVAPNTLGKDVPTLKQFDYIIISTKLARFWYVTMKGFFDRLDFWVPLPLLLIFNALVYFYIRRISSRRKELNLKHKKDIRAARMFLPVIFILLSCNILPIVNVFFISRKIMYREINLAQFLSSAVNSAVNLVIYYAGGASFRKDVNALLPGWAVNCAEKSITKATASTAATSETSREEPSTSKTPLSNENNLKV